MKHIYVLFTLLAITCICCKMNVQQKSPILPKFDPFSKNEWTSKLEKDTGILKATWLANSDPFSFSEKLYEDMGLNVFVEGDDPASMMVIPIVNYMISYESFMKWNGIDPIESIMELSNEKADCYISNGSDIKYMIKFTYKSGNWEHRGWGPMDKSISAILSSIYFDKKQSTINIYVVTSTIARPYLQIFIAYKDKGKYMALKNDGTSTPLLEEIIELKAKIKSGRDW